MHLTSIWRKDNKSEFFKMDPDISNYSESLDFLKSNFEANYKLNKSPFGLHLHYFWFYGKDDKIDPNKVKFVKEFFEYVNTFDNIIYATVE